MRRMQELQGALTGEAARSSQFEADLAAVRNGRILFSHQSVGDNILGGIQRVLADSGAAPLKVASFDAAASTAGPVLLHGYGGRNGDPESKIAFFETVIRGNPHLRPDLAFFKFCWVDFAPSTDVDRLFACYRGAMTALKRDHPEIRFAHMTVTLTPRDMGLKARVRRILGLQEWTDASNAMRNEFNRRLVQAFSSDPLFDLAGLESTRPDGEPVSFALDGKRIPSMFPGYTDDDGHLNAAGQRAAGAAVIRFLASALGGRAATI